MKLIKRMRLPLVNDAAPIEMVVENLLAALGVSLTAFIADSDEVTANRWATGELRPPRAADRALRSSLQAFALVASADSNGVARAWFCGTNPDLDDRSPAEALNAGKYEHVLAAARTYARYG